MINMSPSKSSEICFFQQDDPLILPAVENSALYNRGNYARPWLEGKGMRVYILMTDSAYYPTGNLVDCDGVTVGSSNTSLISGGIARVDFVNNVSDGRKYYAILYSLSGQSYKFVDIYKNQTLAQVGTFTIDFSRWRGFSCRLRQSVVLYQFKINAVISIAMTQAFMIEVHRVNPRNYLDTKLIYSVENSNYIGQTGNVSMSIQIDTGNYANQWGANDVLMVLMKTKGFPDSFTYARSEEIGPAVESNAWGASRLNDGKLSNNLKSIPIGVEVIGYDALYSELMQNTKDLMYPVTYSNKKEFNYIPAGQELTTLVRGNMWERQQPQEYEDIEIAPGEFTRVRNEIHRTMKLETDFMPSYGHEQLQNIFGRDVLKINNVEYIQRNQYQYEFTNRHYGLAKGSVELTERKSIIKNVI